MITTFDQLVAKVIEQSAKEPEYDTNVDEAIWQASSFISMGSADSAHSPFSFDLDKVLEEARQRFPEYTYIESTVDPEDTWEKLPDPKPEFHLPNTIDVEMTWEDLDTRKAAIRPGTEDEHEYWTAMEEFLRDMVVTETRILADLVAVD